MDQVAFRRGVELFNRAEFFEAHEVLEDVWRAAPAEEKKMLQGLIQVAVALHHHSRGNLAGARSLLKRAVGNLSGQRGEFAGLELISLLESLERWENALVEGERTPALPRFVLAAK